MRSFSVLIMLLGAGISFLILPEAWLGLPHQTHSRLGWLWIQSLELLAVPLCLLFLAFSKSTLIRISRLLWGIWMTLISGAVLLNLTEIAPEVTLWGTVHTGVTLITALSLTLFSTIELSKLAPIEEEKKKEDNSEVLELSATDPSPDPELAKKVEGA